MNSDIRAGGEERERQTVVGIYWDMMVDLLHHMNCIPVQDLLVFVE